MSFAPTQTTFIVGLRSLGLFGLSGYLNSHSLLVHFLAVHAVDGLAGGLLRVKYLGYVDSYDEGVVADHADFSDVAEG